METSYNHWKIVLVPEIFCLRLPSNTPYDTSNIQRQLDDRIRSRPLVDECLRLFGDGSVLGDIPQGVVIEDTIRPSH